MIGAKPEMLNCLGEAHARRFVAEGARVILTDINRAGGEALAAELGANAIFVHHDVTSEQGWRDVVEQGEVAFGTIDTLVNNAGILGPIAKTLELSVAQYQQVVDVNQISVFLGMQAVIPSMLSKGSGAIVNISSVGGVVAHYYMSNLAYCASKFAVRGMTKQVALEFADRNIRVNSVHPGYIRTPMMFAATDSETEEDAEYMREIPMRRIAEPEEVSDLVLFLASDESRFITGQEHVIDGGATIV